jgi:glycine cleavage system H protein
MSAVPDDLMYSRTHEWVRTEEGMVVIGITDYAQEQLGEVVYVELPEVGRSVDAGEEIGTLESVKAVSEVVSPIAGEVVAVNDQLGSEPNLVNEEPYGDGWLVKIAGSADEDLLDAAAYQKHCAEEKESH